MAFLYDLYISPSDIWDDETMRYVPSAPMVPDTDGGI